MKGTDVTPHQLRHAFATILYDAGVGEVDTMAIMGHSSIKVTREVYTHIRQERMEQTTKQINEYLREQASKGNTKACQKIVKLA
jgi:integrase